MSKEPLAYRSTQECLLQPCDKNQGASIHKKQGKSSRYCIRLPKTSLQITVEGSRNCPLSLRHPVSKFLKNCYRRVLWGLFLQVRHCEQH